MKNTLLLLVSFFTASLAFSQGQSITMEEFMNTADRYENKMITISDMKIIFDKPAQNNGCNAPRGFEMVNVEVKRDPNRPVNPQVGFKACFIASHQTILMNKRKVGGRQGVFAATLKGNKRTGYVISFMMPKR